jgi:hypothetical protein
MKIEHRLTEWHVLIGHYENGGIADVNRYEVPHRCDVPNCPGAVNKRKLEAFDEMLEAIRNLRDSAREFGGQHTSKEINKTREREKLWHKMMNDISAANEAIAKAAKEPHAGR